MPRIFTLLCIFFFGGVTFAQTISNSLISTAGKTEELSNSSVSWSLGEVIVSTKKVHQGYQFPNDIQYLVTAIEEKFNLEVKIYPNPVRSILNLRVNEYSNDIDITIHNASGETVYQSSMRSGGSNQVNLGSLKSGVYFLTLLEGKKESMTYKIIKE